jgi:hypothetical protein
MRGASQSSQTDGASGVGTSSNVGGVRGWPPLSLVVRLAANATGSIRRWRLVLSAKIVVAALCLAGCSPQDASPPMGRTVPDAAGAAASGDLAAPANRDPLTGSISKPGVFQDIAAESGIEWQYRNGEAADEYSILESLGGGIGLIDFDQDGLLDVFLIGGGYFEKAQVKGHPNRMYRNEGGWKFRDVTGQLGLDEAMAGPICWLPVTDVWPCITTGRDGNSWSGPRRPACCPRSPISIGVPVRRGATWIWTATWTCLSRTIWTGLSRIIRRAAAMVRIIHGMCVRRISSRRSRNRCFSIMATGPSATSARRRGCNRPRGLAS